jgi:transposase
MRAACIIQVISKEASERKLEEELNNLINKNWDCQVKQMEAKEYMGVFPDKSSLETSSRISEILMSVHGIKVEFMKTVLDLEAVEILQPT